MAKCLIEQTRRNRTYWLYAINMKKDFKIFCYNSWIKRTPFEAMYGQKPNIESLKVFDCTAYVHIEGSVRGKKD